MDRYRGKTSIFFLPDEKSLERSPPSTPVRHGYRMTERNRLSTDSSPKLQIPYQKLDNARWKKSHILAWEGKKLHLVVVLVSSIKGRKIERWILFHFFFSLSLFEKIPYPRKVSFSKDNILLCTRPSILFNYYLYAFIINVFFFYI